MPGAVELTPREYDVLGAMADGLSNEAIARKLHLASKTIESVIRSIFIKLEITGSPDENRRVKAVRAFLDGAGGRRVPFGGLPRLGAFFIGDADLVERCAERVIPGALLTMTGIGGIGKTRLALEAAHVAAKEFADGAWFLDLSPVRDRAGVLAVAESVLGAKRMARADSLAAVVAWCRGRQALLVIDNCEHVLGAAAELVAAVLGRCPTVAILATSRQQLGVRGELLYHVAPLTVDDSVSILRRFAPASTGETGSLQSIAASVAGLPLALELVGSRLATLPAGAVEVQLRDLLHLRNRDASVPTRHVTLARTFDWSYKLLSDAGREAFAASSVFEGGFDLGAFEAVAGSADTLVSLVESSLISCTQSEAGMRYALLETAQIFGAEQLGSLGTSVRGRHMQHYVERAAALALAWPSSQQPLVDATFESEWANLRVAVDTAIAAGDVAAVESLVGGSFAFSQHRVRNEHRTWAFAAVSAQVAGPATLSAAANWALLDGDPAASADFAQRGIDVCNGVDGLDAAIPASRLAFALVSLGRREEADELVALMKSAAATHPDPYVRWSLRSQLGNSRLAWDNDNLLEHLDALAALTTELASPALVARNEFFQIQAAMAGGEPLTSVADRLEQTIAPMARAAGSPETEGWCLSTIAMLRHLTGDYSGIRPSIERLYDLRYWAMLWMTVELALTVFVARGDNESASRLLGFLDRGDLPDTDPMSQRHSIRQTLAGVPQLREWMAAGADWDTHEAMEFVFARL